MEMSEELNTAKQQLGAEKESSEFEVKLKEVEESLKEATQTKEELEAKLTRYVSENMELLEKIDKLSKGSSAESIEMVNLTAQENEEYQKALGGAQKDLGDVEISQELNESLRNLREESSELMSKIELFTIERREVLDKLDAITIENQVLVSSIESIRDEKVALEHENDSLKESQEQIEKLLSELQTDKEELSAKVTELNEHRSKLQEEINKLVKEGLEAASSPSESPVKTSESGETSSSASAIDKEACEKLLKQLDAEIQNLNKNKDKHQKLKISKKLSDNAKNVHAMMTNLLVDYYKNLEECQQLRGDLEKVKLLLNTTSSSEDNEELCNLQEKLKATEEKLSVKNNEVEAMKVIFLLKC
jgi:golgin subfamily B member 1